MFAELRNNRIWMDKLKEHAIFKKKHPTLHVSLERYEHRIVYLIIEEKFDKNNPIEFKDRVIASHKLTFKELKDFDLKGFDVDAHKFMNL